MVRFSSKTVWFPKLVASEWYHICVEGARGATCYWGTGWANLPAIKFYASRVEPIWDTCSGKIFFDSSESKCPTALYDEVQTPHFRCWLSSGIHICSSARSVEAVINLSDLHLRHSYFGGFLNKPTLTTTGGMKSNWQNTIISCWSF